MTTTNRVLEGKACLITGATGGLGREIARAFAANGGRVVINGRNKAAGDELVEELRDGGTEAHFVAGDVGLEATADSLAAVARQSFGGLDVLVLNAAAITFGPFWEASVEQFDHIMNTNVRGAWLCARSCRPLLGRGASVIAMGSISSYMAFPGESVYSISKGATVQLVRGMAADLAPSGVRVNALCPGAFGGVGMQQRALDEAEDATASLGEIEAMTPLGRLADPDEIVAGALFLASDRSSFMTGSSLVLDGGILMH